jgi:hypothetical protein
MVRRVRENVCNLNAQPFIPRPSLKTSNPFLPLMPGKHSPKKRSGSEEVVEKKRQISDLFQYYNFLLFNQHKDSFNSINPDLLKMSFKYDPELKNGYMTVQSRPEIMKAALGGKDEK